MGSVISYFFKKNQTKNVSYIPINIEPEFNYPDVVFSYNPETNSSYDTVKPYDPTTSQTFKPS